MSVPQNQAAWLTKAGTPLEVSNAPLPTAGAGEIVVKNVAVATNPLDIHMHDRAAILPDTISFADGAVLPVALESPVTALSSTVLKLSYPSLDSIPLGKTLVVYGGSSSLGSMITQTATAAGIHVISISGAHNFDLSKRGAAQVIDHKDPLLVDKVVEAVGKSRQEFVDIVDAINIPKTHENDLAILAKLGGGNLVCSLPPPSNVPDNVKTAMFHGINDIATPIWKDFVTPALLAGKLQCLPPPTVVGDGVRFIEEALEKAKAGISATKLVVTL